MNKTPQAESLINPYAHNGFYYIPGASLTDNVSLELLQIIHSHWSQFPPQTELLQSILYFCYFVLSIASVVINFYCLSLIILKRYKMSNAVLLVLNIVISELAASLVQFPLVILNLYNNTKINCEIYGFTGELCTLTTLLTLAAMSFQRYRHLIRKKYLSKCKTLLLIVIIWGSSIAINIPPLLHIYTKYCPEALLTTCTFDYLSPNKLSKYYTLSFLSAYALAILIYIAYYCGILVAALCVKKIENVNKEEEIFHVATFLIWAILTFPSLAVKINGVSNSDRKYLTPASTFGATILAKIPSCIIPLMLARK